MKTIMPDSCLRFACLAGACRHTCCAGWEIDVDAEALARYRAVPGVLGLRIREAIEETDGATRFRLTAEGRCPFLNRDNLCDLIIGLGEGSLCQICADHPRFRQYLSDRTEIGLGLCCEVAGRLVLGWQEPMRLVTVQDDGHDDPPDDEELALLSLRDTLIARMQDRTVPFADRLTALSRRCRFPDRPWRQWRAFLLTLERLDEAWAQALNAWIDDPPSLSSDWDVPFEQLAVYLLFRHLPGALDDGDVIGRVRFCVLVIGLLRALLAACPAPALDDLVELARLYSAEIEYSDENVDAILAELAREA